MSAATADPTRPPVDLSSSRRIHIVGIGGAGMSAIAIVLAESGHRVTGTDAAPSAVLDRLAELGVGTAVGHAAAHLPDDTELLSFSTAVPADNPELEAARRRGIPVLRRSALLAAICAGREAIAVAGTHGKTTTSSVLAEVLDGCGRDCGFLVGARIASLGTAARAGTDPTFVVEADESDGTAFVLPRAGAVVTNVEPDHLEHHGGFAALRSGFDRFVADTPGPVVVCLDDPVAAGLARAHRDHPWLVTYGTSPAADVRLVDVSLERSAVSWGIEHRGHRLDGARLALPGLHNALNATAAVAAAVEVGCDPGAAVAALGGHRGVSRRFEPRGVVRGVTFVDDYAHLPTEVAAAIAAARGGGWERVVCVFQPHRYSRTEALWSSFADAFAGADHLVLCGIYAAGEAPRHGVTGELLLQAVLEAHPGTDAVYCDTLAEVADHLDAVLRPGDLCLTLGAGDVTTIATTMSERWA
jgi:UDP-N-acetylmuramate--alanine ligase